MDLVLDADVILFARNVIQLWIIAQNARIVLSMRVEFVWLNVESITTMSIKYVCLVMPVAKAA